MHLKEKLANTALMSIVPSFWLLLTIAIYWETVSLNCQPNPVQVVCKISGETVPGETRVLEIPKAQLAGIDIIDRQRKGKHRIGLITIDKTEIPLTRNWSGDATVQLEGQIERIRTFIADPHLTTLNVSTHRRLPLFPLIMTGGILWFHGLWFKRVWLVSK
ncbi:hypothetical protein [Chamaesiphon sp. OTE_75_metabat_556]|jgi:hypothetical protein|uniref:hypothetical protein n=1 Tax=Chamaesiphon sp. OTE_75_metabat_556 TaxID=2964692 RepID=UPI00286C31D4|nr:hypothetical protein [Chamaesiphon sp. OTE_75_metabat_556]